MILWYGRTGIVKELNAKTYSRSLLFWTKGVQKNKIPVFSFQPIFIASYGCPPYATFYIIYVCSWRSSLGWALTLPVKNHN